MMTAVTQSIRTFVLAALAAAVTACGGTGTQSVRVYLIDAPLDGATAVNVTLTGLKIFEAGPGAGPTAGPGTTGAPSLGATIFDEPRTVNLLDLRNGNRLDLGTGEITNRIAHMQLTLSGGAEVVYENGTTKTAAVPSGAQTGIKLAGSFDPSAEEIVLDFDAAKSIVENTDGSFSLVPVIRVIIDGQDVGGNAAQ